MSIPTQADPAAASIVVIGAGPVGLTAALDLARQGLMPIVLEAKPALTWSSRAICLSRRSQEIFDRIGAGPAFAAKALPWSRGRTFHRDRLVFRLEMPYAPDDHHAPFVNLQQCHTEQFLLDAFRALGGDVRWGHSLAGLTQGPDGVVLTVATPDGSETVQAGWVVAADGGRSATRDMLGLTLDGTSYEGRYLIADIQLAQADWPVERHVWFDPPSNPGSTVILHVQPDGVWRIDYQLQDGEDAEAALRDDVVTARLQAQLDMMGVRQPWRMIWKSVYRAHCLTLADYVHGRVVFAGDAAHLVPIFGVRGLNSGIDDAHNLAWKLALVARGDAPPALLASYTRERLRAARENHANAAKSTWFMSPPTPGFRQMRDAVLALAANHAGFSQLINPRQATAHVYADSPIVVPDAVPDGIPPGMVLPDLAVTLRDRDGGETAGHLLDALPALGFALLLFVDRLDPAIVPALAAYPVPVLPVGSAARLAELRPAIPRGIVDRDGALAGRFAADRFPLLLIRPDQHVAARLPGADPAAVAQALDFARGRPAAITPAAITPPPVATQTGMERIFEAISHAVDAAAVTDDPFGAGVLARLALLLAEDRGDVDRVLALVEQAKA